MRKSPVNPRVTSISSSPGVGPDRRTLLRGLGLGAVAMGGAGLLAACGAREPQANALEDAGKEGFGKLASGSIGRLRVSMPGSLSNLYPGQESGVLNYVMAAPVVEGLMTVDSDGKLVPGLASGLKQPDGHTFVYTLDQEARFSDGSPVTTRDVMASIDAARDTQLSPSTASYWSSLKHVRATGEHEITFTTKSDDVTFVWVPTTVDALWVMPERFWKRKGLGGPTAALMGSGPYRVSEFVPSSHLSLERNPHWRGKPGDVKSVRVDFIADDTTRLLAWQSGAMDISLNVALEQAAQWAASPETRLLFQPDRSYAGLTFNLSAKPFDDIHVRRAIALAIDKSALVSNVLLGQAQAATALSTPEQFGEVWSPKQATRKLAGGPQYAFDLHAAKVELAASSVPKGFTASLSYPNTGPQLGTAALAFSRTLAKIGIRLHVKQLAIEQWLAELDKFPPLSFMWYFNTTGDPGELPSWFLAKANPAHYRNKAVERLMATSAGQTNPLVRAKTLVEAQQKSAADLPYLPLWWGRSATAFASDIGVRNYSSFTFNSLWPQAVQPTAS